MTDTKTRRTDPRRCPMCGAFDAWMPEPRAVIAAGLVVEIVWTCGICHGRHRIPIRPPRPNLGAV